MANYTGESGMSGTEDDAKYVNKSENLIQKWLILGALIGIPLALLFLYYKLMFVGLVNINAFDYAQLGRNLSEGRGFTTYFLRPLALVHGDHPLRQAEVTHGPLFPILLALVFAIRGATDAVAASVSGVFFLLTVPIVYLLGQKVFSRKVAMLAAFIFAASVRLETYTCSERELLSFFLQFDHGRSRILAHQLPEGFQTLFGHEQVVLGSSVLFLVHHPLRDRKSVV